MIDGMRQLPLVHRKRFMNYYIAKYKRLGLGSIFNGQFQERCSIAIVHSLQSEIEALNTGLEATAPEWSDRQSTMRACDGIALGIMRGDYAVAWVGDDDRARKQIADDGIEIHRSMRELITACIARYLPGSDWIQSLEHRSFVVVRTI